MESIKDISAKLISGQVLLNEKLAVQTFAVIFPFNKTLVWRLKTERSQFNFF